MHDVGHENLTPSSPPGVSGDPSEKGQDGFSIKNAGNDAHGERFPFSRERRGGSSSILKTQQVHHSSDIVREVKYKFTAEDDGCSPVAGAC